MFSGCIWVYFFSVVDKNECFCYVLSLGTLKTGWLGNRVPIGNLFFAEGIKEKNYLPGNSSNSCLFRALQIMMGSHGHFLIRASWQPGGMIRTLMPQSHTVTLLTSYCDSKLALLLLACWCLITCAPHWPLNHRNMLLSIEEAKLSFTKH